MTKHKVFRNFTMYHPEVTEENENIVNAGAIFLKDEEVATGTISQKSSLTNIMVQRSCR